MKCFLSKMHERTLIVLQIRKQDWLIQKVLNYFTMKKQVKQPLDIMHTPVLALHVLSCRKASHMPKVGQLSARYKQGGTP